MKRQRADLRDRLLAEALKELRAAGPGRLSLRAVTTAAGVTPMAAYRHFDNREALLAALATSAMSDFGDALARASQDPDPRTALMTTCVAYLEFARSRPEEFALLFGDDIRDRRQYPELYAAGDRAFASLLAVVERCRQAGVIGRSLDGLQCAASLWVQIHGLCDLSRHWPTSRRVRVTRSPTRLVEQFIGRLLTGLAGGAT